MDEQLQRELSAWMEGIRGTAEDARGVIVEQGPEVAAEMVALGRAFETAKFSLGLAALLVLFFVVRRIVRLARWVDSGECNWTNDEKGAALALSVLGTVALAAFGLILTFATAKWFLAAWFAPRVYLVWKVAELVGGN